jgi:hypothetical protein
MTTRGYPYTREMWHGDVSHSDVSRGDVSHSDVSHGDVSHSDVSHGVTLQSLIPQYVQYSADPLRFLNIDN